MPLAKPYNLVSNYCIIVVLVPKISASILAADFSRLGDEVRRIQSAGADMLHIDVMDGHFVPNMSLGPAVVQSIRKDSSLPFDVHLMIEEPSRFISAFVEAGADTVTLHADNLHHLYPAIQQVKKLRKKVGVALCPLTPLGTLEYLLQDVDLVLQMTVEPGFGGQPFMRSVLPKIRQAKRMIDSSGARAELAVDGGINESTAQLVVEAGADILVMGSAVFAKKDSDLKEMFQSIRNMRSLH